MRAALLFAHGTDPRAPHLALPSLAAALRGSGIEVDLYDADLEGLLFLLEPDRLREAAERLRGRLGSGDEAGARLLRYSEHVAHHIGGALAALRSDAFYDPNLLNAARDVVGDALDLQCAAIDRRVHYAIEPQACFEIDGVNQSSLRDLIATTSDGRLNPFEPYWQQSLFPRLEAREPGIVGISILNNQQILGGLMLARRLRERGHFVVIGGTVFSKFASQLRRLPDFFRYFADAMVLYEGETALLELIHQLEDGGRRDLSRVPNLLWLDDDGVRANEIRVEDIRALPTPDFEGLPLDDYLAPGRVLPILTGKGCYFNRCKFCDIPYINHVSPKPYRVRDPAQIATDVRTLHQRFGADSFVITDEALAPKLLTQLADELTSRPGERYHFTGYARLEPGFTPEACRHIAQMGLEKLYFGLESGSQAMLDHMDKGIQMADVPVVLRNCRDAGIHFHIFAIIGFPEETAEMAKQTHAFFVEHRDLIDGAGNTFEMHPFGLELRTQYYHEAESMGVIIRPESLRRDWIIGLPREAWTNTRGLDHGATARLLDDFVDDLLGNVYRRTMNRRNGVWPVSEEYGLLFARHYRERPFVFETCLPGNEDGQRFHLAWSNAIVPMPTEDGILLDGRDASGVIDRDIYALLAEERGWTAAELVSTLGGHLTEDDARGFVDEAVKLGWLHLRFEAPAT